ncbi:MAG: translation initiation factor IF-2 [Candidatus Thermoplasmatota archaeon]|nr:translation initiation factor IF-2 [Candidatus Thermoplasmatota archaeon]MBS3790905.1 translation initiation factor IF-2 [Candidatus Thermoplasmatota archaeon]
MVSVLGHVDHGKTTFLDRIRGTTVQEREAGAITQHIGATEIPIKVLKEACSELGCNIDFRLPGLLFIDTPGHHSFINLRSRGGALADLAVLIVDINDGFMPQSLESLDILKREKTPFVVGANKLDKIPGWRSEDKPFVKNLETQSDEAKSRMTDALYKMIGDLYDKGFSADRYDKVDDFSQNIGIVPMSAETGEGMEDLLMTLIGLAQTYLEDQIQVKEGPGEGTILEVKEETGLGTTLDTIIHDGVIRKNDQVVIGTRNEPVHTKVKALMRPKPMDEIRDPSEKFEEIDEVGAAAGIKLVTPDCEGVLAGAPIMVVGDKSVEEIMDLVRKESEANIETGDEGVVVKADAIGSLEGLAFELEDEDIPILKAGVGDVSKKDIADAVAIEEPLYRAILAFNVDVLPDAEEELKKVDVEIFQHDVVYRLVEEYEEWKEKKKDQIEKERREEIVHPAKFRILEDHVFRMSKPAIVGVRVLAGNIRPERRLLNKEGRVLGEIKSIRSGEQSLDYAEQGDEVAIAISGVTVGRQIEEREELYVDIPEGDARKLRDLDLTFDEERVLKEIREIKQKEEDFWGL